MRISDWSSDVCSSDLPDDDRSAPALVAAFQRLPHHVDVADAFEAVIGAAFGEADQIRHQIAFDILRVDEVGHAELARQRLAGRVEIAADDHEIGRASSRERMCKYVWVSVGAVALKNKKINTKIRN